MNGFIFPVNGSVEAASIFLAKSRRNSCGVSPNLAWVLCYEDAAESVEHFLLHCSAIQEAISEPLSALMTVAEEDFNTLCWTHPKEVSKMNGEKNFLIEGMTFLMNVEEENEIKFFIIIVGEVSPRDCF